MKITEDVHQKQVKHVFGVGMDILDQMVNV